MLTGLFVWNIYGLIMSGGIYGAATDSTESGYSLASNIIFGWCLIALILCSGLIIKIIVKIKSSKGFKEDDKSWDELAET